MDRNRREGKINFDNILLEDYPLPLSFIVDITWNCNFKCRMCVKRTIKKHLGQRPVEDLITITEKLPWARYIKIGALGDPFMYKDLAEAIRYLTCKKIQSPLTTNGSLMNIDNIKILAPNSILYISVDAGTEDVYKKIRNFDFKVLKRKIKLVRDLRPDIQIVFNCLIFKDNLNSLTGLVDFASKVNASISFFYPMYFTKELEEELSVFRREDLIDKICYLKQYAKEKNVPIFITSPVEKERPCYRVFTEPIIAFDGTVYPCDYVYQNMNNWKKPEWTSWYLGKPVKVPQYQYKMGNIYKDNFIEMWNSPKWKRLRSIVTKLNNSKSGKLENLLKSYDPNNEFEHCKVCLARWSRCL